jgi:hypothetical protein
MEHFISPSFVGSTVVFGRCIERDGVYNGTSGMLLFGRGLHLKGNWVIP